MRSPLTEMTQAAVGTSPAWMADGDGHGLDLCFSISVHVRRLGQAESVSHSG